MPVPNLYDDISPWTQYNGPFTYYGNMTSYNLSTQKPGYETACLTSIWTFENTGASDVDIDCYLQCKWLDPDDTALVTSQNYHLMRRVNAGSWIEDIININIGIAGWEIDDDGTFSVLSTTTGDYTNSKSTDITFSNVPDTSQFGTNIRGHVWVEGNGLCYLNANGWKHSILGTYVSTSPGTTKAGHIWVDTNNDLHWVGGNGWDYKAYWKVKQFASTFSNGPTGATYAGTSNAGYIWIDNEFGWTHVAYIGYDGYKYLTGGGDDPYQL